MGVSIQISFLSLILINLVSLTVAQFKFNYFNCTTSANYTTNSPYKSNLDTLLSSLSSNIDRLGFISSSIGQDSDTVHAIALCRGDLELDICQRCINYSVSTLTQDCPNEKEAIAYDDLCMLRYSNHPINGTLGFVWGPGFYKYNDKSNASDVDQFNAALRHLLDGLRNTAASGSSHRKYASGEEALPSPSFGTLYALVQCTPDLSEIYCSQCLNVTVNWISDCCNQRMGAGLYRPSCNIRYEMNRFYNVTSVLEPPPPSGSPPGAQLVPSGSNSDRTRTIIVTVVPTVIFLSFLVFLFVFLKKKKSRKPMEKVLTEDEISILHSLQYDLDTIAEATEDFSETNKLGQGGFGAVYKGRLPNGQEIAVKRLSLVSAQGEQEFKTEVLLVAKLQHRNLVRLVGFCLEGVERLLIYEFVINGSLDHFIFDSIKRTDLDWEKRYKIIEGVARGLLYLHEDSRLRIIHRDLKASNVLLDADMVPKISDFGLAKLFELDETQGTASRIVGTYGYMAPEYAMHGHFSVKSDVFSFGVLVLEIVSGHKNTCFQDEENTEDLLSYAWRLWKEGTASDMIEPTLKTGSGSTRELMRCIHIGLLCVQENVNDRPTMASVILMLSSLSLTLAIPSKPAFFLHSSLEPEMPLLQPTTFTENEASITDLSPR